MALTKTLIHGIGTASTPTLDLFSVLYLSNFPFNLLVVPKLSKTLNCSVIFYLTHCVFQDLKMKRMIGGGFDKDGRYYFQPSSLLGQSAFQANTSPY